MLITKAYRFKFIPSAAQIEQLSLDFGASRFVYNTSLDAISFCYRELGRSVTWIDCSKAITELKKDPDYAWLRSANSAVIAQRLRDLDTAFKNFFAGRAGYPNFHKKRGAQSARYQLDQRHIQKTFNAAQKLLILPKLGALKLVWSQPVEGTPKMVTVSRDAVGDYFVSFACEIDIEPLPKTKKMVGIDLGITDVITTSDGEKSGNPKFIAKYQRQLKRAQQALSRKQKGSNRRNRARIRVAKIQRKIARCRSDFLHKLTTDLVRSYDVIAIEDLNISGMMKNRKLSKAVGDIGAHELTRQLSYKTQWHGKELLEIDRWTRSTGVCPDTGVIGNKLPLKVRHWTCDCCNIERDRDTAAAQVILNIALRSRVNSAQRDPGRCLVRKSG